MQKSTHCFMNKMVAKNRDIRSNSDFSPLVNHQVPSNIRKLVSIVQMLGKKEDKTNLFYECECLYVNSVEYSTWVANVKIYINNTWKLALEYWDTKQKWLFLEINQRYVAVIGIKYHVDMQSFNTVAPKVQTNMKKHNIIYPGHVKLLAMPSVIRRQ